MDTVRITPEGVGEGPEVWQGVYNPSFDVTPAELISKFCENYWTMQIWLTMVGCVVTEKGVAERQDGETAFGFSSIASIRGD